MTDIETELRTQINDALADVDFPAKNQFDILPALPNGVRTKFQAGDVSISVATLATKLGPYQNFPYDSVEELTDDVMTGLKEENII